MKKTLKQQNERLSHLLEKSQKSDRNGDIISIGFAAIIAGLTIFATVQSATISKLERSVRFKTKYIERLEHKVYNKSYHEQFKERCNRLSEISGKVFSVVTELISEKKACNHGQAFLYSKEEIEDAMKHYQLGSKENKK